MANDAQTIADLKAQLDRAEASLEKYTRRTTFPEYLKLIHEHCALHIRYDPKSSRNTRGGVTKPRDRITPKTIAPWDGFDEEQAATYQELCEVFQDKCLFPNEAEVIGAQRTINDFLITSEQALATFTNVAQVTPTKEIVNQFISLNLVLANSRPGFKLRFSPRGDPDEDTKAAFAPVDGVWDYDGPRSLMELKPPHKLTEGSLQQALDDGTGRSRRVFETEPIINSPHATNDPTYIVTAVFTQVFDYMVESGTTRAYLDTGMAYVFFDVRELEPTTLYYNLVIPPRTSTAHPAETSVCQLAIFICRSLTKPKRDADWIRDAVESNGRFLVDSEAQLNLMSSPLSSASEVVTPGKEDYKPPLPKRKRAPSSPMVDRSSHHRDDASDDDGSNLSPSRRPPTTRSRTQDSNNLGAADASQTLSGAIKESSTMSRSTANHACKRCPSNVTRRYCSTACLLGLMYSFWTKAPYELDMGCPNVERHSQLLTHQLTRNEFRKSLRRQFARSHAHAIEHLKLRGSSGHWFAITLCSHGYTFVGKGSRIDKTPALVHEFGMFAAARPLQGRRIPVCLGLVDLIGPYYLPAPNHLTQFLLLSCGGIRLSSDLKLLPPTEEVISSFQMALRDLHQYILHGDVRVENLLWNTELQCGMIIDFGESTMAQTLDATSLSRHHLFSVKQRNRGAVRTDAKPRFSSGIQKSRVMKTRCPRKSTTMMERKEQEIDAVKGEVLRWLPPV